MVTLMQCAFTHLYDVMGERVSFATIKADAEHLQALRVILAKSEGKWSVLETAMLVPIHQNPSSN